MTTPRGLSPEDRLLLDLDEAARRLSVSRRFLQGEIYAGRLKSCKAGRRRLIAVVELEKYVAALQNESDREGYQLAVVGGNRVRCPSG